jgi:hypothetical protein
MNGKYLELTELGDGVRHLVSIVTSLYTFLDALIRMRAGHYLNRA